MSGNDGHDNRQLLYLMDDAPGQPIQQRTQALQAQQAQQLGEPYLMDHTLDKQQAPFPAALLSAGPTDISTSTSATPAVPTDGDQIMYEPEFAVPPMGPPFSPAQPVMLDHTMIGAGKTNKDNELDTTPPKSNTLVPTTKDARISVSGLYSSTDFDMLGVLVRVASRKNPKVSLGPVDMSCSFVVSDARTPGMPIVYVSRTFEKLTGYDAKEIVGRNCRFLQSPDGLLNEGSYRRYTDNATVYELRKSLEMFKECQFMLINYRKGGEPFINLVTIIPIPWETEEEIAYFVGFQVDLVAQPNAVIDNMKEGTYVVNYQTANMPVEDKDMAKRAMEYFPNLGSDAAPPVKPESTTRSGFMADMVKTMRFSDLAEAKSMFHRAIIDQCDFVHVLSLRGIFLYVSTDCARMLEYEADELLYKPLSDFCHPGDLIAAMRDLKKSASGRAPLRALYRIRRKYSGYVWLEIYGRCAQGDKSKCKKFVVVSGRERPVARINRKDIGKAGGVARGDAWSKLTVDGLTLYSSLEVKALTGFAPTEVVGKSLMDFLHADDIPNILQAFNTVAQGCITTLMCRLQVKGDQHVEPSPPLTTVPSTHSGLNPLSYRSMQFTFFPGNSIIPSRIKFILCRLNDPALNTHTIQGECNSDPTTGVAFFPGTPIDDPSDDIFEEICPVRCTSWQYELHQLRLAQAKYEEELENLEEVTLSQVPRLREYRRLLHEIVHDYSN